VSVSDAERQKARYERKKRGQRVQRVVVGPGEMIVVVDIGAVADQLGVPDWDQEVEEVVRARLKLELERLNPKSHA
jgi:hypothetical protein